MSAAEIRQRRREKILMGSQERMKKLLGTSLRDHDDVSTCSDERMRQCEAEHSSPVPSENPVTREEVSIKSVEATIGDYFNVHTTHLAAKTKEELFQVTDPSEEEHPGATDPSKEELSRATDPSEMELPEESQQNELTGRTSLFYRYCLVFVFGILVRLALSSNFAAFVQTLVYPFVALEISFFGLAHTLGIDGGSRSNKSGGIYVYLLRWLQIEEEVIATYLRIMGCVYSVVDDFAVYLFAFIMTHVVL